MTTINFTINPDIQIVDALSLAETLGAEVVNSRIQEIYKAAFSGETSHMMGPTIYRTYWEGISSMKILLALVEDTIQGFCTVKSNSRFDDPEIGHGGWIAVDPLAQGQGIGTALQLSRMQYCAEVGRKYFAFYVRSAGSGVDTERTEKTLGFWTHFAEKHDLELVEENPIGVGGVGLKSFVITLPQFQEETG